jgi:L-ascorbate metabolism protein UlaG (beta-lactamase superfamily)
MLMLVRQSKREVRAMPDTTPSLTVFAVGGPTAVLEFGGLRILTDPSFDPPGETPNGLRKIAASVAGPDDVEPIDLVLLSHEHHDDNLDVSGRAFLPRAGRTLTTTAGAERLSGNATGLEPWSSIEIERHGRGSLTITATPAQHGPDGSDEIMGPVIGFVLTGEDVPTLYVSGDNASVDVVRTIAERLGPIELAVLFTGGVSVPHRFDGAYLTLSADRAAQAARVLGARAIVPVHFDGWAHFTQGADELRAAFDGAGLGDRLVVPEPGDTVSV